MFEATKFTSSAHADCLRRPNARHATGAVAAVLLAALLSGCSKGSTSTSGSSGTTSAALTKVTIQFNWVPNSSFAGWYVADVKGFYKRLGIDFQGKPGGPNLPDPTQVVDGGAADIGVRNMFSLIDAISKGADLVMIGARLQQNPYGILSLPDKPIKTAKDICGKKIGSDTVDIPFINGVLQANGLPTDCYKLVPVGADPGPLVAHQIDGQAAYATGQPIILKDKGTPYVFSSFADMGLPLYGDVLFVKRSYLQTHHAILVRWMRATIQGWESYLKDPSYGIDLTMNQFGGKAAGDALIDQSATTEAEQPLMQGPHGLFWLDTNLIAGPMYAGLKTAGVKNLPSVNQLVDTTILQDAYGGTNYIPIPN
jgi:ABC-type nitrate/sulfonate/bicarbonate transport system substrate-binding protein